MLLWAIEMGDQELCSRHSWHRAVQMWLGKIATAPGRCGFGEHHLLESVIIVQQTPRLLILVSAHPCGDMKQFSGNGKEQGKKE